MRYNKNIGFKGNLFLLKNKIKNKISNHQLSLSFNEKELRYKPLINIVTTKKEVIQSYKNITITSPEDYNPQDKTAEYVCFAGDDILTENAIYVMVEALQDNIYDMIYCDEYMDNTVFYKPDWSPDTLKAFNYIGCALVKNSFITDFKDCYSLLLDLADSNLSVYHISKPLVKSIRKPEEHKRELKVVADKISIIIPSKDNYEVLKRCIDSIKKSSYKNYEIIVVDNGSSDNEKYSALADKYIYDKYEFNFSKMCNIGAQNAEGRFLLFLNDDTEVITKNWLEVMSGYGMEKNVGAVGVKLYYPDSTIIQHCGVVNIQPGPVHYFVGMSDDIDYYFGRNRYTYNVSAVTAACLLIEKSKFIGFDESFKVSYNDVDLCLSLMEKGYYNVVLNDVKLYHYESFSRGDDRTDNEKMKRLAFEKSKLYKKHKSIYCNDSFYNVNLSRYRADFSFENVIISKAVKINKPVEINYTLEYSFVRDGVLYAGGYTNTDKKVYAVFGNKAFETKRELRSDLCALYGMNYALNGFFVAVDIDSIDEKDFVLCAKS